MENSYEFSVQEGSTIVDVELIASNTFGTLERSLGT